MAVPDITVSAEHRWPVFLGTRKLSSSLPEGSWAAISHLPAIVTMRCFISLALSLLALEVALAQHPLEQVINSVLCAEASSGEKTGCSNCLTNAECAQNTLCCSSSCGAICKTPVNADVPKAGHCPWNPVHMLPAGPCLEKSSCSRDSECTGNMKCCRDGCVMKCKNPQAGFWVLDMATHSRNECQ
ncbi:whey acidic protein [Cricetulus griseus]|uniref:Whey acidic protein n=1 Tax=Cricetulus griseus TaxID=10029 RepID=A0A061IHJ5_CRIGR|nr:whey acidic protein [Cricetulus griseus]